MSELKKCPFCNEEAESLICTCRTKTNSEGTTIIASSIECLNCGASGPQAYARDEVSAREDAAYTWNDRGGSSNE